MDLAQDAAGVVARAAAGDRAAWAVVWDAHGPALHRYAQRLLRDEHDAADAVADTFVSAAEHLAELRDPERLRPWLYAICRRHVQRRWEARDRVRPYDADVLTSVVDARQVDVTPTGDLDAAEAAALLWAAAEGMGPADRELLSLVLSADLDSGDVAAITGQAPSAVYVKVSRLRDALGRSAGALLVARHHREDCPDLDALLATWDGVYAPVWRKRIARHVDACDVCGSSRTRAAAGLFSLAGLAPLGALPLLLRDRAVDGATRTSAGDLALVSSVTSLDLGPDGFAVARPWEPERDGARRGALLAAAAALLLVVGGGAVALAVQADAPPVRSAAASTAPLAPVTGTSVAATATAIAPTTAPVLPASPSALVTVAVPQPSPAPVTSAPATSAPAVPPRPTTVPPTVAPTTRAPLPVAPAVVLRLSEQAISTACGDPTTSVATATASGAGALTTRLSWDGTAPGSQDFDGAGVHAATVGPYASTAAVQDVVTVTAVVTDALGRTATATQQLTVSLAPC